MKEEALKLANELDWHWDNDCRSPAISNSADMIRKLVAELDKREKEFQTTSNYSQLVLRTNEQLMLEVVLLRKANEQSHIDY